MLWFHPPSNVSTLKVKQKFTISNARVATYILLFVPLKQANC